MSVVHGGSNTTGLSFARQTTKAQATESTPAQSPNNSELAVITVDYPENQSIFPPEITPPTFIWRDASETVKSWRIQIDFADGTAPVKDSSPGLPLQIGEIDPRCISSTNKLPSLNPKQAAAHTWKPDAEMWAPIKVHSSNGRRS